MKTPFIPTPSSSSSSSSSPRTPARIAAIALVALAVALSASACAKRRHLERPHEQPDPRVSHQVDTTPTDTRENYAVDQAVTE